MADWNNPQTGQIYTSHFESIRDKDNALAKMFDGTSETNLPDGAIKINSGSKYRIEKWDASASSWNTVIPGLGNLTQAEVDQLATIGSTTISGTQWGYLGNLDQNLRTTDSPDFGGVAISSTQYGYLGGLGSAPLEDDDLAANGGTVAETDRKNIFTSDQRISDSNPSIEFDETDTADKNFVIVATNGELQIQSRGDYFGFQENTARFHNRGGVVIGAPSGGDQGSGTLNAEALYDNENRVYSASNAPASTALSDGTALLAPGSSSDPGLTLGSWRTPNASRATFITINYRLGDAASSGTLEVDEGGGTTADYTISLGSTTSNEDDNFMSFLVPAGGSYRVSELSASFTILDTREWTL